MAMLAGDVGLTAHTRPIPPATGPEERLARLRLARSENVGPRTFLTLLSRFGRATQAVEVLPELAARGGKRHYELCPEPLAAREIERGEAAGASLVLLGDAAYPRRLAAIPNPPPAIWLMGDAAVLSRPAIAVVGARNASALGLRQARRLALGLADAGQLVVSGLARGIDRAAHEAVLDGCGTTAAVLPGGIDVVYPEEHAPVARRIAGSGGAVVTECPPGTEATARHFPRRNRLVSGLSDGVVLVEAAARSGSLITARCALEQGREVLACPGAPEDPRAAGCNELIRDGAALVRHASDVLEAIAPLRHRGFGEGADDFRFDLDAFDDGAGIDDFSDLDPEGAEEDSALAEQIMALISTAPVETDELARLSGASPAQLSLVLLELDLAGRIALLPGGLVVLRAD
ncbi:MAG: DNA-processing protein DprA [Pseudomonadota bacterium]